MIEDSDIGPENSSIAYRDIVHTVLNILKELSSRKANWVMISYILLYFLLDGSKIGILDISVMVIFLLASVGLYVFIEVFNFYRIRKIEKLWDRKNIQKLSKGKKNIFTDRSSHDIKIGDVVLIKANCTCPVDILILDTAEQRHSDKIAYVNERRLNGTRAIIVKKSVKNLNPQDDQSGKKTQKVTQNLNKTLS